MDRRGDGRNGRTGRAFKCVSDKWDPWGQDVFSSLGSFYEMCQTCFGEQPALYERAGQWFEWVPTQGWLEAKGSGCSLQARVHGAGHEEVVLVESSVQDVQD